MSDIKSFWPSDLAQTKVTPPKTILVQQANFLNEITKNTIVAEVETYNGKGEDEKSYLVHSLEIKAPSLGNYSFTLVRVIHEIILYPVNIYFVLAEERFQKLSEEEYIERLKYVLSADITKKTLSGLLAQV